MEQVRVEDAKPGMVLVKPIIDKQGRTIVKAGATLSQLYISRLPKWGVTDIFVEDAAEHEKTVPAVAPVPVATTSAASDPEGDDTGQAARSIPRPPGVYSGADLEEVIDRCFSGVIDEPLMVALHGAVKRNLLTGPAGEK